MVPVTSSTLAAVGYDADRRQLHLEFVSGERYVYSDVDEWVYHELLNAESKGSYFNRHVREQYGFTQE